MFVRLKDRHQIVPLIVKMEASKIGLPAKEIERHGGYQVADAVIRTSDRSYFKRCRQLWDFTSKIRQNWEPIQRIQALDFGTAMHAGWEAYYNPETWGLEHDQSVREQAAVDAFLLSIRSVHQKVKVGAIEFETQFEEDKALGLGMLTNYFAWAPKYDDFKVLFTEVEFEVPIPDAYTVENGEVLPVVYQGRIDMIVEDEYGYWIWDHKTAASFGETSWLPLDDQCTSYAWALKKSLGLEIRGVIYNEARKKAPRKPERLKNGSFSRNKQQDTSFEIYLKTLREEGIDPRLYRDFLSYLKHNPKEWFRRTRVEFSPRTLNIVERRIQLEAGEMLNDPAIYPTPSKFNCNGCSFFRPCLALQEGADPDTILNELYEKRTKSK